MDYCSGEVLIAALSQAIDAIVIIDAENRITFFNPAAERLWGMARSQVIGRNVSCLVPSDIREQHDDFIARHRATGVDRIVGTTREVPIVRPDGSRATGLLSLTQIVIGEERHYMAFVHDVTADATRRTELHLLSLVANETDRVVLVTDAEGRIAYVNRAFSDLFGYVPEEAVGQPAGTFLSREPFGEAGVARLRERLEKGGFSEEFQCRSKHGSLIWVSAAINPIFDPVSRDLTHVVSVLTDITEIKLIQDVQREVLAAVAGDLSLEDVSALICRRVEAAAPGTVCTVLRVDELGCLRTLAAPSLPASFCTAVDGLPSGPEVGSCGTAAFLGEPVVVEEIATSRLWEKYRDLPLPGHLKASWSVPVKLRDGRVAGTFALYFPEAGPPKPWHQQLVAACVPLCTLALERYETKAHIERLAFYDTLTGLPNRTLMQQELENTIASAQRSGGSFAILFVDIDHFKDVNETLGHATGDVLLVEISHRVKSLLRGGDVVARVGSDEFLILIQGCEAEDAAKIAERILEAVASPVSVNSLRLTSSTSIGISLFPAHGTDAETLLKRADVAMYEAKREGRGTYRFFSPELNVRTHDRLLLGVSLRDAVRNRRLRLHFQPQIDTLSGALYGVEALARWTDPEHGEVPAGRFIPLAEEYGIIEAIDHWAVEEACRQMARWRRAGVPVPHVSVNLSAVSFRTASVTQVVSAALAENGLVPGDLRIEITERVMMDDHPSTSGTARAIDALGVRLAMDDFGTGYSSLSTLAHLPVAELKIDRSFTELLDVDPSASAVATAVIRIGQSLGMTVVAEGVETQSQSQSDHLRRLGCHALQGYLFAPALAPDALEAWMAERGSPGPATSS